METTTWILIATAVIGLINRLIPNEKTQEVVDKACYKLGVIITQSIGKIPIIGSIWQEVVEKWCIDLLLNILGTGLPALKRGLRSDNPENGNA